MLPKHSQYESARGAADGDVYEIAQRVAQDYVDPADPKQRGIPAVAAKMGMPVGTLYNKLNPNDSSHHKLTLADLIQLSVITRDYRLLQALCRTLNHVCFAVPDLSHVADEALLDLITKVGAEGGDFYRAINAGLSDGRFKRSEYERVRKEGFEFIAAIVESMARLEGLVDA